MTVGDILDGVFKLFKANARSMVTIVAIFTVPIQLIAAWTQRDVLSGAGFLDAFGDPSVFDAETAQPFGDIGSSLLVSLAGLLVLPFMAGAISQVVAASYLGETLAAGPALRRTLGRFWALLGSWFITHLPLLAAAVVMLVLLLVGAGIGTFVVVASIGFLVVTPLVLAVSALSVVVAPAIVVEELGPIAGVRRSWSLVWRRFWPVVGISLLAGLITGLVASALSFVPSFVALFFGLEYGWIVLAVGAIVASLVSEPIVAIAATLIYFDLRIRTEGFDLQVIATGLAASDPAPGQH